MKFCIRYMDDVLVIWKEGSKIDEFAKKFTLMQFGLTLKKDQVSILELHYLDLYLQADGPNIRTSVYRKLTFKPILIPNWSKDPINYKKVAFRSLYRKVLNYCGEWEDLRKELNYIRVVGIQHRYSKTFLWQIFKQVKRSMTTDINMIEANRDNREFLPVPYHLKDLSVVKKVAKNKNRRIASERSTTVFNALRNEKDPLRK